MHLKNINIFLSQEGNCNLCCFKVLQNLECETEVQEYLNSMPLIIMQSNLPCFILVLTCIGASEKTLIEIFCLPRNEMALEAWLLPEEEVVAVGTGVLEHLGACRK